MMQSAPGYLLDLRLYLEGIRVPVIGASVTASIGTGATANIDIIPHDTVDLILPRTIVHLFYLDHVQFKKSGRSTPSDGDYKLLFSGEVFSISQSKAGMGSRSVSLNCMDFSNVLDTSYIYSMNYSAGDDQNSSILANSSRFLATLDSEFDNIINSPSEMLRQLSQVGPSSSASPVSTSVLGGLLAIMERLLGVQGRTYGVNQWTTIHERQVRLLESLVADSGDTAAKIFEAAQFSDWLRNKIGSEGNVISFRRVVDILLNYIMYSMVPNPVAKYVPGTSLTKPTYPNRDVPEFSIPLAEASEDFTFEQLSRKPGVDLNLKEEFRQELIPFLAQVDATLRTGVLRGGPAEIYITKAYREAKAGSVARYAHELGLAIDIRFRYLDQQKVAAAGIISGLDAPALGLVEMPYKAGPLGTPLQRVDAGPSWYLKLRHAIYRLSLKSLFSVPTDLTTLKDSIIRQSDIFSDIYSNNLRNLESDIIVAKDWVAFGSILVKAKTASLDVLLNIGHGRTEVDPLFDTILGIGNDPVHVQSANLKGVNPTTVEDVRLDSGPTSPRERLHSFVIRPDVWFVSPPRSNVMFPDMIQSFSAQREMMRETSRLSLAVGFEFAETAASTSNTIFAPQLNGQVSLGSQGLNSANQIIVYDHEKFSGVVPKFERMLDTMFYINKEGSVETDTLGELATYAPKVAHFHLLNERYQARQASVALAFSPHIICGFPGVVVDAVITSEEAGNPDFRLNRSFKLGMVASVTHSISQAGAQTQVRMTHVRSHRAGDKTDDLFANIIGREGTLEIQDPTRADQQVSGEGVFLPMGQKRTIGESNKDFEFGWSAIAATFNCGTIEDLIYKCQLYRIAYDVSAKLVIDPSTLSAPGDSFNAADYSQTLLVAFKQTRHRGKDLTSGTWTGTPTLAWIRTSMSIEESSPDGTPIDSDKTEISIGTTPPAEFNLGPLDSDTDFALTRFYFDTGQFVISYIPILLPGTQFEADMGTASTGNESKILPVEESIRPIWMSDAYGAARITNEIYDPFFGTRAIVDDVRNTKYTVNSVEEAVDQLCVTYAKQVARVDTTRSAEVAPDPLEWIYEYTRRDVATYPEILGSKQVRYDTTKQSVVRLDPPPPEPLPEDAKYYGGFHSNAVNFGRRDYGSSLEFLDILGAGLRHLGHSGGEDPFTIDKQEGARLDPRAERAKRVLNYVSAIDGPAALGVTSITGIGKRG